MGEKELEDHLSEVSSELQDVKEVLYEQQKLNNNLSAFHIFLAGYGLFVVYKVCRVVVIDFWRAPL